MPLPNTFGAASARGFGAFNFQTPKDPNFSSVSLLLPGNGTNGAQNNTFLDSSANNFTITRNGNTTQGTFSPFPPSAGSAWSAATNGGSGYFDGSGDYLSGPTNNAVSTFAGDFTIEGWCNFNSIAADNTVAACIEAGPPELGWIFRWRQAGLGFRFVSTALGVFDFSYTPTVSTWFHVALTRAGSSLRCFVNGTQIGTTQTMSGTVTRSTVNPLTVGGGPYAATSTNGYLSDVRVVNGTAVYTSNFTPPTAPLTAITNTSLLLNFTNGAIYDAAAKNDLETVGNAQTSTAQSKWGGSSMYFDGTGDWLSVPNNAAFDFGSGDFTIEMWVYPTAVGQSSLTLLYAKPNGSGYSGIAVGQTVSGYGAVIYASSNGTSWNLVSGASAGTMTANAWNHVAVTRSGTNIYGFVGGVLGSTTAVSTTALVTTTTAVSLGSSAGTANTFLTGYLQDLRITNGVARYTSNFTPPTAPFPVR